MRIEKPEHISKNVYANAFFRNWFKEQVEPINKILEAGTEVRGNKTNTLGWSFLEYFPPELNYTHKALLINIEPIKKETAEDVLRDMLENMHKLDKEYKIPPGWLNRAKKVLSRDE